MKRGGDSTGHKPNESTSSINNQTIKMSRVYLPSDKEAIDPTQEQPVDTETEAKGQPSSSQRGGGRGRSKASSSAVPPNAFQIILKRIDSLREVQNEHSDRLTTIQDQINLLTAKFDSFLNQP